MTVAAEPGAQRSWFATSVVLLVGLLAAVLVRLALFPRPGLAGDIIDFTAWARAISINGLGSAYDQSVSFPPVLPWIWALLGTLFEGMKTADPNDPTILALMKLPASVADLVIAGLVAWSLRRSPGWAAAAFLGLSLHPAVIYVSAWWGQFDSMYVLPLVAAYLLAVKGRPGWAAIAIAIALMTKPQALPLAIPFAAWYLGHEGWRGTLKAAVLAGATVLVLWLPFLAAGGPARYLANLAAYADLFGVLSLRAWNPWWILQDLASAGNFVLDTTALIGPVSFRWIGLALAAIGELLIFIWLFRRPTPAALAWGLAASALVAFCALTTMHERYAYPALAFLALAWPDRRAVILWVAFGLVFTANVVAAIPPGGVPGQPLPIGGSIGILGSLAMTAIAAATMLITRSVTAARGEPGGPEGLRHTSAGTGAATSGA